MSEISNRISLQAFRDISNGTYNAGQVDIRTEGNKVELVKINNHVWRTSANNVQLSFSRIQEIKEAFVKAIQNDLNVSEDKIKDIRAKIGLDLSLGEDRKANESALKNQMTPLSREKIRQILTELDGKTYKADKQEKNRQNIDATLKNTVNMYVSNSSVNALTFFHALENKTSLLELTQASEKELDDQDIDFDPKKPIYDTNKIKSVAKSIRHLLGAARRMLDGMANKNINNPSVSIDLFENQHRLKRSADGNSIDVTFGHVENKHDSTRHEVKFKLNLSPASLQQQCVEESLKLYDNLKTKQGITFFNKEKREINLGQSFMHDLIDPYLNAKRYTGGDENILETTDDTSLRQLTKGFLAKQGVSELEMEDISNRKLAKITLQLVDNPEANVRDIMDQIKNEEDNIGSIN